MIFLKPYGLKLFNVLFPEVVVYVKQLGYNEGWASYEASISEQLDTRFEDGFKYGRDGFELMKIDKNNRTADLEGKLKHAIKHIEHLENFINNNLKKETQ